MMNKIARRERPALTRWSPFNEFNRLRQEMDRLFGIMPESEYFEEGFLPPVDVYETKEKVIVKAELPGLKKEEIQLSVQENILIIHGERKKEEEVKDSEEYRSERFVGKFQRTVALPQSINPDKIEAHYKDGVLTVSMPKSEEQKARHIDIKEE